MNFLFLLVNKDVLNYVNFDFTHQIPFTGTKDYMFNFMGNFNVNEFRNKTKLLRSFPKHLKNTLFLKDERIEKIRKKEFTIVFFAYDEIKDKGNNFYKTKNYCMAISYYTLAYSIIKWMNYKIKNNGYDESRFILKNNININYKNL